MIIDYNTKLDFDDVLIVPKRSTLGSRKAVDLVRTFTFRHSTVKYTGIPIIAANMDHTGTFEMSAALSKYGVATALHKHYSSEQLVKQHVNHHVALVGGKKLHVPQIYSMGIADREFQQLKLFIADSNHTPSFINVDVANGYTEAFVDHIAKIRDLVGADSIIMAGNVVTGDMVSQLLLSGADVVKVGIGPGSVCTTRKMTGVGYPQLSAIIECMDAAHGLDGHICADGGCKVPGDVAKAFAAGADFVMLGGMFAGHTECGGDVIARLYRTDEVIEKISPAKEEVDIEGRTIYNFPEYTYTEPVHEEKKFMQFYGMSSDTAMEKYAGGVADYRASEGKTVEVPYKGSVSNTIQEILGGIRSTCTIVGARQLKDLSKCTTFVLVNRQLNTSFGS